MTNKFTSTLTTLVVLSSFLVVLVSAAGSSCRQLPSNPDACCKVPKHELETKVIDECVKTWGEQTQRERADKLAMQRGCCIAECVINGTGHTDLSEAKMVEVDLAEAEVMGMKDDWEPVIKAAAKTCADEMTKQADRLEEGAKLAPVDPKDTVCHPKYVFSLMCTTKEYILNCPAKYYTESKECTELKEFLSTCEM